MFKFAAYTLEVNGALGQNLFKTREGVAKVCAQHGLDPSSIVQLFRFTPLPAVTGEVAVAAENP